MGLRALLIPAIGASLSLAMARSVGVSLDWWGVLACVAGVHAAYRFDALADDVGFPAMLRDRRLGIVAGDGALLGLALLGSPSLLAPLAVLSLVGLCYVPLKRWVPKNLLTAGAWTATIFALSLHGVDWDPFVSLAAAALFLTVLANGNLCDVGDVEADRQERVLGLGTLVGARATARIAGSFGLAALGISTFAGIHALWLPAALYAAAGWLLPLRWLAGPSLRPWMDGVLLTAGPVALWLG